MDEQKRELLRIQLAMTTGFLASLDAVARSEPAFGKYDAYVEYVHRYNSIVHSLQRIDPALAVNFVPYDRDWSSRLITPRATFDSVHANVSMLKPYLEVLIGAKPTKPRI